MPTFVVLGRLTAQAKKDSAASLRMRDQHFAEFRKRGLEITSYSTMGPYDVVLVVSSPSEELMMQFLMVAGATGNIETTTLRAFTDAELARARAP